jgi:hypothetical protein
VDADQKTLVFNLRKNLERGEVPTPKSIYKLLELAVEIDRQLTNEKALLNIQLDITNRLLARLELVKEAVIKKVEEAFI